VVEDSQLAEALGFDVVLLAEHHFWAEATAWGSPLMALAGIAQRTKTIQVGTGVLLLPLYQPVHVAEDAAFLDMMSGGRLILGLGLGYVQEEFDSFQVPLKERGARLEEGVQIIERLWTEDSVSFDGKFTRLKDLTIFPKPTQKPRPPIILGGWAEKAVTRAARIADGWMSGPSGHIERLKTCRKIFDEAWQQSGKSAKQSEIHILREVYVDEDPRRVKEIGMKFMMKANYETFIVQKHLQRPELMAPRTHSGEIDLDRLHENRWILGTPEEVIEEIQRYQEELNPTLISCRLVYPGMPREDALRSIRLFGEKVLPKFK
jgi:probable F420-dependent oxidoreductase